MKDREAIQRLIDALHAENHRLDVEADPALGHNPLYLQAQKLVNEAKINALTWVIQPA